MHVGNLAQRNINSDARCIHGRSRVKGMISAKRMPRWNREYTWDQ